MQKFESDQGHEIINTSEPVGVNALEVTFLALIKSIEEKGPHTTTQAKDVILRAIPQIRRRVTLREKIEIILHLARTKTK